MCKIWQRKTKDFWNSSSYVSINEIRNTELWFSLLDTIKVREFQNFYPFSIYIWIPTGMKNNVLAELIIWIDLHGGCDIWFLNDFFCLLICVWFIFYKFLSKILPKLTFGILVIFACPLVLDRFFALWHSNVFLSYIFLSRGICRFLLNIQASNLSTTSIMRQ